MTETEIYNLAMLHLGQKTVSNLETEASREAEIGRTIFDQSRDTMLRQFPWPFARRRVALALTGTAPTNWGYAYALPTDCVQALAVTVEGLRYPRTDQKVPFEIGTDGTKTLLFTDLEHAELIYTMRVENTSLFDPLCAQALSWLLAAEAAMPLSVKPDLANYARQGYLNTLSMAQAQALNEGWAGEEPVNVWIAARGVS